MTVIIRSTYGLSKLVGISSGGTNTSPHLPLLQLSSLVPNTRKSCRKTLILTYIARYEALIRILVIIYFFKVKVTEKVMYHI